MIVYRVLRRLDTRARLRTYYNSNLLESTFTSIGHSMWISTFIGQN